MANHDRSLVPVPSYLRDLYQLITLLLSDRRVAAIADFRALSEVNHEAEVNRLVITIRGRRRRQFGYQANRAALDFVQFAKHCIRLTRELE